MNDDREVQWTAKLPALLIGLLLILVGILSTVRGRLIAAIIAIALGGAFVGYSLTIKDWCELKGSTWGQSAFGNGWGGGFGICLRQKGWLSF